MRYRLIFYISALFVSIFFLACSNKEVVYNKPATFWYEGIIKNIRMGDLESADNYYASLQSEHINSPLLPESMLMLGQAHLNEKEYILADFYFKEYLKRYGNVANSDYIMFLRLKSYYYGFRNTAKDQQFITTYMSLVDDFLSKYPNSRYLAFVQQMEAQLTLGQNELNIAIARVYKEQKKEDAEKLYLDRVDSNLQEKSNMRHSKIPWYMWILNW